MPVPPKGPDWKCHVSPFEKNSPDSGPGTHDVTSDKMHEYFPFDFFTVFICS